MDVVHLYAESGNVAPRNLTRKTGYVLEYITKTGRTVTRERFTDREGTYNAVTLQMIAEGLQRLVHPCEVHVHTQNRYILTMMSTRLEEWKENGYRTARGDPVSNDEKWKQIAETEHLLVPEPGSHPYLEWMLNEMRKNRNN